VIFLKGISCLRLKNQGSEKIFRETGEGSLTIIIMDKFTATLSVFNELLLKENTNTLVLVYSIGISLRVTRDM